MALSTNSEECAPLLSSDRGTARERSATNDRTSSSSWRSILLVFVFVFAYDLADVLSFGPSLRLMELSFCRRYYLGHDPSVVGENGHVDESFCKINDVQATLAHLRAMIGLVEGVGGILLVLPYGLLAERMGRKLAAGLNVGAYALYSIAAFSILFFWQYAPIETLLLAAFIRSCGGGSPVISSVIPAIVSDATPPQHRSTLFFWLSAAGLVTEILGPLLSSYLMAIDYLYLPLLLGFPLTLLSLFSLYHVQDTHSTRKDDNATTDGANAAQFLRERCVAGVGQVIALFRSDYRLIICAVAFIINRLGRQIVELLVQYTSKKFHWSLGKANTLLSLRAVADTLLMLLALPAIVALTRRYSANTPSQVDLKVAKISYLFLALGSLALGLSETIGSLLGSLVVFTFGAGFRAAAQSVAVGLVSPSDTTRLFTGLALLDAAGSMFGAALLNASLARTLKNPSLPHGLPFYLAAGLYFLGGTGFWFIQV